MEEYAIKKLVAMVRAVQQQRDQLSNGSQRYFLQLETIKKIIRQVQSAADAFKSYKVNKDSYPPAVAPAASSGTASSPIAVSAATPIQKTPTPKPIAETPPAPTPSASAATPAASAPTPTDVVSSLQTPKSPRNKPATKAKAIKATPAPDVKSPATPATPASTPPPESTSSSKRQREDEPATPSTSVAARLVVKKIKMEFDEPPSDVLAKRQAEADAVQTDEEAIKFFEQMSNWLNQVTSEDDGQDSLKTHIADHLDEILKAYPDMSDDSALSSLAGTNFLGGITIGSSSPRQSAVTVDPSTSHPTGSRRKIRGSASETEGHPSGSFSTDTAKIAEPKGESSEDTIPHDLWRAFDGGESAFYNASDNLKWDEA
ncbi:hypothetical protein VTO73DRAFT_3254 [Trametes versicolor]